MQNRPISHRIASRWSLRIAAAIASAAFLLPCIHLLGDAQESSAPVSSAPEAQEGKKQLPSHIAHYLDLIQDKQTIFGPLGKWQNSEIEIILNPEQIQKIQNQTCLRLMAQGHTEEDAQKWSRVGIVAEDNYWIWLRDAVIFPSGVYGTYDRLMLRSSLHGVPGVAILPVLSTKKIVVNVHYRHATRTWEIELPRGHSQEGETVEKTAARELKEETGYRMAKCAHIGTVAPDTGILISQIPVYYAEVNHSGENNREYSEAILNNPAFSKEELKQGFARGYIEVMIKGEMVKVHCRDPFLAYALLLAEMKGLL